ncbi:type I glyceraldehyde-3-phosphate dehydrogenase [Breznakiella homolactica]|uniref:Glyceraldehyde-3-phosphate dehydrogenase n=2 Tax=Bacteria TaxID=2 RepID=A0A7T7XJU7_9SPIR|nr:type I glyceraldehyde-3-phosphate dehydrogenase [Breznakiella homolactica]
MAVRVAINGFGRIGRLAFRQMFGAKGYEIVAINDITKPEMLAYLLKYDTTQGKYQYANTVKAGPDSITVRGKKIKIYAETDAAKLPWKKHSVDVVLECTGFYTSKDKAQAHIKAGAKKVVISAPAGDNLPTVVFGVNERILKSTDTIISTASCTTNCLALMADALNKYAPIQSGIMVTVHAYTGEQSILDAPNRKGVFRRSRAGAANIAPVATGAAKAIGLVIPEINGKLTGAAQRVPVPTGSTTILVAAVKGKNITTKSINEWMKKKASKNYGYNDEEIVSSDIVGMTFGSLFDATQTLVLPLGNDLFQVQTVAWYDNESSYTTQMVKTIKYFAELKPGAAKAPAAKGGKKPVTAKDSAMKKAGTAKKPAAKKPAAKKPSPAAKPKPAAAKKPAPKKPAAKKAVPAAKAKPAAAKKPAAKKPAAKKPSPAAKAKPAAAKKPMTAKPAARKPAAKNAQKPMSIVNTGPRRPLINIPK